MGSERSLYSILYVSAADRKVDRAEVERIVERSRILNEIFRITGILLYEDGNFMQLIEGPEQAVRDTMARIKADWRHSHILVLLQEPVAERSFASWSMAFPTPSEFSTAELRKFGVPPSSQPFGKAEFEKLIKVLSSFGSMFR